MKKKQVPQGPAVVDTYETEIEFNCPVRGKIKQKVKVKRYASIEPSVVEEPLLPNKSIAEKLDQQYSGLLPSDDSLENEQEEEIE